MLSRSNHRSQNGPTKVGHYDYILARASAAHARRCDSAFAEATADRFSWTTISRLGSGLRGSRACAWTASLLPGRLLKQSGKRCRVRLEQHVVEMGAMRPEI